MLSTALMAIFSVVLICLFLGGVIGLFAKAFAIDIDPRIEQTSELLPGANCGGCGYAGCADFAKAVVSGEAKPEQCPVNSAENRTAIEKLLGLTAGASSKSVAVVLCGGDDSKSGKSVGYNGITDCKSAMLVAGGDKACPFGCLGFATCARACPFGAIEMINNLAVVHRDICVGCGKCVTACPRKIIRMVPVEARVHVFCSSTDKGPEKRKYCSVSCIGCRKCVKAAEEGQIEMEGFLAKVNYEKFPDLPLIEKAACPTGCLRSN